MIKVLAPNSTYKSNKRFLLLEISSLNGKCVFSAFKVYKSSFATKELIIKIKTKYNVKYH